MKNFWLLFMLTLVLAFKSYAEESKMPVLEDTLKFEGVQEHCVQVGEIKFGPGTPWKECHIVRARWMSTIDLIDMYQTQYCLGNDEQSCEQRAWVIFANRAYTKEAKALIVRIDPATTVYKDPIVIVTGNDYLMSMTSFSADGIQTTNYYRWDMGHWMSLNTQNWLPNLPAKLPKGTAVREPVWTDLESMSAKVNLFKKSDKDCCPTGGKAIVELGYENNKFFIKNVNISSETQ